MYLYIVNAICLHRLPSHLRMYLYYGCHLKFPGSLRPDTLCLFIIRYACSRYSVSGRDTPCLGHNTLCLFEECGACSHYGDWLFVVPVATTNWILTLIPPYNNTSFGWFWLRKIVDCCGYTLSISLSTPTGWLNLPLILFQAREFEMAILFGGPSLNTLQICTQLTATTCSCYCYLGITAEYPATIVWI